jgi:hypothetical protein
MTNASSTSQSSFLEPLGMITLSFGPQALLGALEKSTGSAGEGRPDSAAWSA